MENLLHNLKTVLQKDERFVSEGELLKNEIIELALKLDKDLIKLLLSDKKMKEAFFTDADGILVFDKDKFIRFVSNKQFLPDSYTSFKNKIGLTVDDEYLIEKKEVVLSWPYKDCVLEGGMTKEDQERDEIFWNEALAPDEISRLLDPKVFTNAKRIDKNGEHKLDKFTMGEKGNIKDNLIVKGNNLLAIHSLKKRFSGKIKLIYIDPPYNTGNDSFRYNDSFNHSSWLTFIKNRLEAAKELLKNDGVIFVHCDDNEQQYLKVLMDEVFKRENFAGLITIKSIPGGKQSSRNIAIMGDYILVYGQTSEIKLYGLPLSQQHIEKYDKEDSKGKYLTERLRQHGVAEKREDVPSLYYPIYFNENTEEISTVKKRGFNIEVLPILPKGGDGRWIWSKEKVERDKEFIEIRKVKRDGDYIYDAYFKKYLKDELRFKLPSIWDEKHFRNEVGTKELKFVFGGKKLFSYPKPEPTIQQVIESSTLPGDIVLDFFAGSGTTGAVAMKMNRQFILCEQMEYVDNVTVKRIKKVMHGDQSSISKSVNWKGGSDFVYLELMRWNENFVEKIQKAKTKQELVKLWETMKKRAFLSYKVDVRLVDENAKDFADLSLEDQKKFLFESLDKNHLYVNYSEINDKDYEVSEEDKRLNRNFYQS